MDIPLITKAVDFSGNSLTREERLTGEEEF